MKPSRVVSIFNFFVLILAHRRLERVLFLKKKGKFMQFVGKQTISFDLIVCLVVVVVFLINEPICELYLKQCS